MTFLSIKPKKIHANAHQHVFLPAPYLEKRNLSRTQLQMNRTAFSRPAIHLLQLDEEGAPFVVDDGVGRSAVFDSAPLTGQAAFADPPPQGFFFDTDHAYTVARVTHAE